MPPSVRFTSEFMGQVFSIRDPARYGNDNNNLFLLPVVQMMTIYYSPSQLMISAIIKVHADFVLYQKKQRMRVGRIEVIKVGIEGRFSLMVLRMCNLEPGSALISVFGPF